MSTKRAIRRHIENLLPDASFSLREDMVRAAMVQRIPIERILFDPLARNSGRRPRRAIAYQGHLLITFDIAAIRPDDVFERCLIAARPEWMSPEAAIIPSAVPGAVGSRPDIENRAGHLDRARQRIGGPRTDAFIPFQSTPEDLNLIPGPGGHPRAPLDEQAWRDKYGPVTPESIRAESITAAKIVADTIKQDPFRAIARAAARGRISREQHDAWLARYGAEQNLLPAGEAYASAIAMARTLGWGQYLDE